MPGLPGNFDNRVILLASWSQEQPNKIVDKAIFCGYREKVRDLKLPVAPQIRGSCSRKTCEHVLHSADVLSATWLLQT